MTAPVTAADLYAARTALGFTETELAAHIDSTPDNITRWETGNTPIPGDIGDAVERLTAYTNGVIDALTQKATRNQRLAAEEVPDGANVFGRPLPDEWRNTVMQRIAARLA